MTMQESIRAAFAANSISDPAALPALQLAYAGDTVYDLFVRTFLLDHCDASVHALHNLSAKLVCAHGQAEAFHRISPLLTAEELAVYKRGRNAHSATIPKHATVADYRVATGLETLLGYLYLSGEDARLSELMAVVLQNTNLLKEEE
ncbi:MAG: ribonuclease III [Clostridiales bacterium]|nr:ribonuclease III [Clostridiales bacterium]